MSAVSKTAKDALLAKHSAVVHGNFRVASTTARSDMYKQLLVSMTQHTEGITAPKRQTPLVNAGYAMRVAALLSRIESFLSFHQGMNEEEEEMQLVLLGAGLDVTGLWLLSILQQQESNMPKSLHVIEVDASEICLLKKNAMSKIMKNSDLDGRLIFDEDTTALSPSCILHGSMDMEDGLTSSWTLVEADLRDLLAVESALSFVDQQRPTIVMSELVLAYLDEASCDTLLNWCSTHLCIHPTSCLVIYEPLGPHVQTGEERDHDDDNYEYESAVVEGYKRYYYQQFAAKLECGRSKHQTESCCSVHPLAISCKSSVKRLHRAGFGKAHATLAGTAALMAAKAGADLKAKELFDEHAALEIHLRSYTLTCAFSSSSDILFRRCMCPWTIDCPPQRLASSNKNTIDTVRSNVWLASIERQDEEEFRCLFSDAYRHLYSDYPSIRRMVQATLKKELAPSSIEEKDNNDEKSAIYVRFQEMGGCFLVAVRYPEQSSSSTSRLRRVLGGVGVRRMNEKEVSVCGAKAPQELTHAYEFLRLAVAADVRGCGIGKSLLQRAEEVVSAYSGGKYHLIATTLSILDEANSFYVSNGFKLINEVEKGDLTFRIYSKTAAAAD